MESENGSAAYLGIDVGTTSARAGVFDARGRMLGVANEPIGVFRPQEDFVEHASDDVWRACGVASRAAIAAAGVAAASVRGIGFDATCSLVVLGAGDRPVSVCPTGDPARNVIVWMDHRATAQAARINASAHPVLRYVGGVISPEMETPKLLWLKENMPAAYASATRFFDLPDFLVWRATGSDVRSLCTTVCKWTYLGHEEKGWDPSYFRAIGLGDLADDGFARIGARVRPMGERAGGVTAEAAAHLGVAPGAAVSVAIIDAHAGGLGVLGAPVDGVAPTDDTIDERVALVGGTSTCHMAASRDPRFIPGVWGPYHAAMLPGLWLTEGGQSATGALIDHVIRSHARGAELDARAAREGTTVYALLNGVLDDLAREQGVANACELTRDLHVLPDHHGNRSPRADPSLRGMISGLKLTDSVASLALIYLATIQAIAHGTKHIVDAMNASGYRVKLLLACGGDTKNPVFVREHADATGCRVVLPEEPEAVLLGSAILGAVASGDQPTVLAAMAAMNRAARVVEPGGPAVAAFHAKKHQVFQRMYADQMAYRALMSG